MLDPDPEIPPVIPPVTLGLNQLYDDGEATTPLVPFTGVTVNVVPLQTDCDMDVIASTGFTVTVTV